MKKLPILCILILLFSQPLLARIPGPIERPAVAPQVQNRAGNVEGQIENSKPGQDYQQDMQKHDDLMERENSDIDEEGI